MANGQETQVAESCLYVHCYGHLLNLALQSALSVVVNLRNCIGSVQSLYVFLEASPKRHSLLQDIQKDDGGDVVILKDQSDTRWSCRYSAVKALITSICCVVKALIQLQNDHTPKVSADARSLLPGICAFDFVFSLVVL